MDAVTQIVATKSNSALSPPSLDAAAKLILRAAGEDLEREGLQRTPDRFRRAMKELTEGYRVTVQEAVGQGVFDAEGSGLVSVRNVEFFSLCEHHMLPFWGKASIAYYPGKKILGLSKVPRLINLFAKRFQVQERLTRQLAQSIVELVEPRAVAVRVEACHLCMMMRGVEKQMSNTRTEFQIGVESLNSSEQTRIWESL